MDKQQQIDFCLEQILRIAVVLVPEKDWNTIHIEGYIVGSVTEVKSWYTRQQSETRVEYDTFDLDYINEDNENNEVGNFVTKIRELTYHSYKGAWYTLTIDFAQNTKPLVSYNYLDAPAFNEPLPLSIYKKDLQTFPRSNEAIPIWLV